LRGVSHGSTQSVQTHFRVQTFAGPCIPSVPRTLPATALYPPDKVSGNMVSEVLGDTKIYDPA